MQHKSVPRVSKRLNWPSSLSGRCTVLKCILGAIGSQAPLFIICFQGIQLTTHVEIYLRYQFCYKVKRPHYIGVCLAWFT